MAAKATEPSNSAGSRVCPGFRPIIVDSNKTNPQL